MADPGDYRILRAIPSLIVVCLVSFPAYAEYGGGSGTADDPYQIATAADLIALGESPEDYDKHFILTADIDLDPSLPGGKVFDKAVIAPDVDPLANGYQGSKFSGTLEGQGHRILNMTISGAGFLGLFGYLAKGGAVSGLGLANINVSGTGSHIGGLVAFTWGAELGGTVLNCYGTGMVSGDDYVGGLVGKSDRGSIVASYSSGTVRGVDYVGGLVGSSDSWAAIINCYSTGAVSGSKGVGGLVGSNWGRITTSYSTGRVSGNENVGGLVGSGWPSSVTASFWDTQTSGQSTSVGGLALTTAEMQTASTFFVWGTCGNEGVWSVDEGKDYPRLWWENRPGTVLDFRLSDFLSGNGMQSAPYLIYALEDINTIAKFPCEQHKHFRLAFLSGGGTPENPYVIYSAEEIVLLNMCPYEQDAYYRLGFLSGEGTQENPYLVYTEEEVSLLRMCPYEQNAYYRLGFLSGEGTQENPYLVYTEEEISLLRMCPYEQDAHFRLMFVSGEGTQESPFLIYTAYQLDAIGIYPYELNKYFKLMADIDLDPNLPGRRVFDKAVIAPDTNDVEDGFQGTPFTGVFDGNGHTVLHLTIAGGSCLGLFGQLDSEGQIHNLGVEAVDVNGITDRIGGLVGRNYGRITRSYSTGTVSGYDRVGGLVGGNAGGITTSYSAATVSGETRVGGLVGVNGHEGGSITASYSTGVVTGAESVGGLVGNNSGSITVSYSTGVVIGTDSAGGLVGVNATNASITTSYSTGRVSGTNRVGGLVGGSNGSITTSCSTGTVSGNTSVGGLVGLNYWAGSITTSYSRGGVGGEEMVGGLAGDNDGRITNCYSTGTVTGNRLVGALVGYNRGTITTSFWDIETSAQVASADGTGLTTADMQDIDTFLSAGWDFVDETVNGTCDSWQMPAGDYPDLFYHPGHCPVMPEGLGTAEEPYLIRDAWDLGTVWFEPMSHYRLEASVDLSGITWAKAVVPWFGGTFDGKGHTISHLTIVGESYVGLFGQLGSEAIISNLGLEAIDVNGIGSCVGGLVAYNGGSITASYSTGTVNGTNRVGGLVGENWGSIATSSSTTTVNGTGWAVGGLVGHNIEGSITNCYNAGTVTGARLVGGLVGSNWNSITTSYNTGTVIGTGSYIGGLVGENFASGDFGAYSSITMSYSTGKVSGPDQTTGGLVGRQAGLFGGITGSTDLSFWDIETSGQTTSGGGEGKSTAQMQTTFTFLVWGTCGNEGIWTIDEGNDYPRLWWENRPGEPIAVGATLSDFLTGSGTEDNPYLIYTADDLNLIGLFACDLDKHFRLMADVDLSGFSYDAALIAPEFQGTPFTGVFDGNGHTMSHLTITGGNRLGLFGRLNSEAEVRNLGVIEVNITGSNGVGGLAGSNGGRITACSSTGTVNGRWDVGGLVGGNWGGSSITMSYSTATVSGETTVGGLVGYSYGSITLSYSTGVVGGDSEVGGLVGEISSGSITTSYSAGMVSGNECVGGLVGRIGESGTMSTCFWDTRMSGDRTCVAWTRQVSAIQTMAAQLPKC